MTPDDIQRILLELIYQLPPEMRPGVGQVLGSAAATQSYWTSGVVMLLAAIVFGLLHLYYESLDA